MSKKLWILRIPRYQFGPEKCSCGCGKPRVFCMYDISLCSQICERFNLEINTMYIPIFYTNWMSDISWGSQNWYRFDLESIIIYFSISYTECMNEISVWSQNWYWFDLESIVIYFSILYTKCMKQISWCSQYCYRFDLERITIDFSIKLFWYSRKHRAYVSTLISLISLKSSVY